MQAIEILRRDRADIEQRIVMIGTHHLYVLLDREIVIEGDHTGGIRSQIRARQPEEAVDHQPGARQQDQSERDLTRHQRAPKPMPRERWS